ncbi:NADPH-dependent FMN reductase [Liquorilactobacillus satsumensis]|uniref:Fumarate reductase, flavoprotein subunit n=1 Tax=Liquorilactobacillus satsumensis DSM 16230 = JCM 12392 TaxID=1423801 RepID=A0A0R1UV93_9LACO|nr:NADPH-dependent FMN reductase [Liquorilactobacillus satsumensis]KRL97120.1 fumarate reductase, flavoprotein subunit precursor [Liquorilactobacillus satsumensis DSM 16230 = JCM 12392]
MTIKLIGLVGNNAPFSYNRLLLRYMKERYQNINVRLTVQEITEIPLFSEKLLETVPAVVKQLAADIKQADGLIIATPEYDHAIPASLKSTLEWLSCYGNALTTKPVMIVGTSLGVQGTSRAQDNLRQILNSPGINAFVLPGYEFLLGLAKEKFDSEGQLTDQATLSFLDECFKHFQQFVLDNQRNLIAVRE